MDSPVFEFAARELERITDLNDLESRGTLRLALKEALFDARSVDVMQMKMVVERVLPRELALRHVANHDSICKQLGSALKSSNLESSGFQSPDAIFDRLIRR